MKLSDAIRGKVKKRECLWKGPDVDGVTQTLLSRFLCCRERFRLLVVDGLKPVPRFSARLEYGNLWHVCEEAHAARKDWRQPLLKYCQQLAATYRSEQTQVDHWYEVCKLQFPVYVDHWKGHKSNDTKPLYQEKAFKIPYELPSGRVVVMRGKYDAVHTLRHDTQERGKFRPSSFLSLQENKVKGDIDELGLQTQLGCDFQTMIYLTMLHVSKVGRPVQVCYNVVRRPLAGGKYTIVRHKATKKKPEETRDAYYKRLQNLIAGDPDHFFKRWKVEVSLTDIAKFRKQTLDPILEQLCDWWESIRDNPFDPWESRLHFRYPNGVYNPLLEGNSTEYDELINHGSIQGLSRATNLFPEL